MFEDVYLHIAEQLSQRYQGVNLLEARVVVQAYCILRKLPMGVRASNAAYKLAFDSTSAKQMCANYTPPNPVESIRKSNNKTDLRHMFVTEYDQSEIFQDLKDKDVYWNKFQWVRDPLLGKLRSRVMDLPGTAWWTPRWFTPDEICDASEDLKVAFHDPSGHHRFLLESHILPQDSWIPKDCLPTSEEITFAKEELSRNSELSTTKAVLLLSGSHIPHDQHEYTQEIPRDACAIKMAPACLVCNTALCNGCRNALFPFKESDGTPYTVEPHPVQRSCTMQDFRLALMRARKTKRMYNFEWSAATGDDETAPLAGLCFVRALFTFGNTGATALDYQKNTPQSDDGINVPILSRGEDSLEPADDGASDEEFYLTTLSTTSKGSYYHGRTQDRQ